MKSTFDKNLKSHVVYKVTFIDVLDAVPSMWAKLADMLQLELRSTKRRIPQ